MFATAILLNVPPQPNSFVWKSWLEPPSLKVEYTPCKMFFVFLEFQFFVFSCSFCPETPAPRTSQPLQRMAQELHELKAERRVLASEVEALKEQKRRLQQAPTGHTPRKVCVAVKCHVFTSVVGWVWKPDMSATVILIPLMNPPPSPPATPVYPQSAVAGNKW